MRSIGRFATWAATLATTVGATIVLAGSPATAADGGGYWAWGCEYGRVCVHLSGIRSTPSGSWYNLIGCGGHQIGDYYDEVVAYGNPANVHYIDDRWDRVNAWSNRPLDPTNLATNVWVLC